MKVVNKYINFTDIFSLDLVSKLPKENQINDYAIELVNNQQLSYGPNYKLEPVILEILKAYIATNLAARFIKPSKSPVSALILFDRKSDRFFQLCIDYRGLNNLTIKNQYPLPLLIDRLEKARRFTKHDFTRVYHWIKIRKEDKWKTTFKTWYGHFEY